MNNEGSDLELKSSCKDVFQRCIKCGACMQDRETGLPICPSGEVYGFESYYLRGKVEIVRGLMEGRFDSNKSSKLTHILYSCTDCRACVEQCYLLSGVDFLKCVRLARASLTEKGTIPSKVSEFLEHIYRIGNPYGYDQEERAKFLEGLGVDEFDESQEYLYYVDGIEVYDALARNTIAALVGLLQATKISFGVIYRGIECTGNEVLSLGEKSLFDYLKQRNLETFRKLKVRKILTTSPHTYHALAKLYGLDNIKVFHHTQLIKELITSGKLKPSKSLGYTVTYHDPCFLGRWSGIYEEPRDVLKLIPGLKLVEMPRNRSSSFCCGGGTGNFYTDMIGTGPAVERVKEAASVGADVIAVACPICKTMLSSGVTSSGLNIKLMDVAELVLKSI